MERQRPVEEIRQRSEPPVRERLGVECDGSVPWSDFAKKEAENRALKVEIARLKRELEAAKRDVGGASGDRVMHSVVDTLLHQATSLSTLVFLRGNDRPSARR